MIWCKILESGSFLNKTLQEPNKINKQLESKLVIDWYWVLIYDSIWLPQIKFGVKLENKPV